MTASKIIVLTPIKNELWILYQFLSTTSLFADCIIVADQNSTDGSREVYKEFPKVYLIENTSQEYDEAQRQMLLINTARHLFPNDKRILIALDADELFSADSLNFIESWEKIKQLQQGTTIYIEKPDILPYIQKCIRHKSNYFPIGYADDEIQHKPKLIHSRRVPLNNPEKKVYINDIKVLHFALSRRNVLSAKHRYYSIIENLKKITPLYLRRKNYRSFYDEHKWYHLKSNEDINQEWLKGWDEKGINLRNLEDPEFSWQDFEVLRIFKAQGHKKFYGENIWRFDWEACRKEALKKGFEAPVNIIKKPNFFLRSILKTMDLCYASYNNVMTYIKRKH